MARNNLQPIPVLRTHLEEIERALEGAQGFSSSHDVRETFRSLGRDLRPSALTTLLENQLERVRYYLDRPEEEDEPVSDE
jgi:hypothetical protein